MSVVPSNIRFYGSANMQDVDGATQGGAVAFNKKISFADVTPTGTVDYVSSSASDTAATITVTGRDSTGVIKTETKTLTGTTPVAGSQSFERLEKGLTGGTTAVGVVAVLSHTAVIAAHTARAGSSSSSGITPALFNLQTGDGASISTGLLIRLTGGTGSGQIKEIIAATGYGTDVAAVDSDWSVVPDATTTYSVFQGMLFNLAPNQVTEVRRPFFGASADVVNGVVKHYYEKIFAVNDNTVTALTSANVLKFADPASGVLDFALTAGLNDTATVVNRQTAPVANLNSIAATTLAAAITTTGATSATVASAAGFPASIVNGGYVIQIDSELILVTAGAGTTTWTLTRGYMGTAAATHLINAAVTQYFSNGAAPQTIAVPSPQNLPSGATPNAAGAQGVWLHLTLAAGLAPGKSSFALRETGTTT